jgi:hypothetical protein
VAVPEVIPRFSFQRILYAARHVVEPANAQRSGGFWNTFWSRLIRVTNLHEASCMATTSMMLQAGNHCTNYDTLRLRFHWPALRSVVEHLYVMALKTPGNLSGAANHETKLNASSGIRTLLSLPQFDNFYANENNTPPTHFTSLLTHLSLGRQRTHGTSR